MPIVAGEPASLLTKASWMHISVLLSLESTRDVDRNPAATSSFRIWQKAFRTSKLFSGDFCQRPG
jgi:hypothetical protein